MVFSNIVNNVIESKKQILNSILSITKSNINAGIVNTFVKNPNIIFLLQSINKMHRVYRFAFVKKYAKKKKKKKEKKSGECIRWDQTLLKRFFFNKEVKDAFNFLNDITQSFLFICIVVSNIVKKNSRILIILLIFFKFVSIKFLFIETI